MPVFDFHCHPGLKPLTTPTGQEPTPWEYLKATVLFPTPFGSSIGINRLFNSALNSQSNLSQLFFGQVNLAGIVLYAMENQFGVGILKKKVAATGKINLLDPTKLTIISKGKDYYSLTKQNVEILLNHSKPVETDQLPDGVNFKFIKSISEYNKDDLKTIHGIAIVEGMHAFANDVFSSTVEADIDRNFDDFVQRYAQHNVKIFACNITHLQHLPFGTHASGLQFIDDSLFYPEGSGLTQLGKNIVRKLNDNKILVDVKHMAYSTRIALYAERDIQGFTQPIICTHAGIAGCSWDERFKFLRSSPKLMISPSARDPQKLNRAWQVEHLKLKGHVKPPNSSNPMSAFNLSSINLYDEDIMQIFRSDGLIGISLDQRIVGYPGESIGNTIDIFPSDVEYISDVDAKIFFRTNDPSRIAPFNGNQDRVLRGSEAEDHNTLTVDSHARYFLNQVIHILAVAKKNNHLEKALTQVCIGSDFDGLINPIDCCETAESFGTFKQQLKDIMNERNFWSGTGLNKNDVDIERLLNGLFFDNAHAFLKKNFV